MDILKQHQNKYIRYHEVYTEQKRTKVVGVYKTDGTRCLGVIKWYGAWRQYVFYPYMDTLYNDDCLACIAGACKTLTDEQRAKWVK